MQPAMLLLDQAANRDKNVRPELSLCFANELFQAIFQQYNSNADLLISVAVNYSFSIVTIHSLLILTCLFHELVEFFYFECLFLHFWNYIINTDYFSVLHWKSIFWFAFLKLFCLRNANVLQIVLQIVLYTAVL